MYSDDEIIEVWSVDSNGSMGEVAAAAAVVNANANSSSAAAAAAAAVSRFTSSTRRNNDSSLDSDIDDDNSSSRGGEDSGCDGSAEDYDYISSDSDYDANDSSTSSSRSSTRQTSSSTLATTTTTTTILHRASIISSLRPNTNTDGLSDYELLRLQKIQRNEAKLASLGLCGITSKNHATNNNNSSRGSRGIIGGNGAIGGSGGIHGSSKASFHSSPPTVPQYPSKPRQLLHPTTTTQTDNRSIPPGPGWTVVHDESFCRTWISPTRKIQFSNLREAFQFEELRKHFGNDEDMAWEEYYTLKPDCIADGVVVVSPEKADDENISLPSWSSLPSWFSSSSSSVGFTFSRDGPTKASNVYRSSSVGFTSSRDGPTKVANAYRSSSVGFTSSGDGLTNASNVYRTRSRNRIQDATPTNENIECGESNNDDTCFVCKDGGGRWI